MLAIGVDPGLKGGMAMVDATTNQGVPNVRIIALCEMPIGEEGRVASNDVFSILECWLAEHGDAPVAIEATLALPGQAVKSAFSQGYNYGLLIAGAEAAGKLPEFVHPITWATWAHKYARRTKESKKDTWEAMSAIVPPRELEKIPRGPRTKRPHDGIVDALAIAVWRALTGGKK